MPTTAAGSSYDRLLARVREARLLASTAALLEWDQETLMPRNGVDHRARQISQLARMVHELTVSPEKGALLAACEEDPELTRPELESAANLREIRRDHDRATKIPAALVAELAEVSSQALHAWQGARRDSSFEAFRPWLSRIVDLLRQKAACLGTRPGGEPWDALADEYEPELTARDVDAVFAPLSLRLSSLIQRLLESGRAPRATFDETPLALDRQKAFVRSVARQVGFDFDSGRLDTSTHPFCSSTCPRDVRMTTRFVDDHVLDALSSTLHETGHGLYEQGLPVAHTGTPLGEAVSLSIHESQSRLWENQVGRSLAFQRFCLPLLARELGGAVKGVTAEELYGCANRVERGFIRVEADEATYNLHILLRFEIERSLLAEKLDVADVPAAWNARFKELFFIDVPDDRRGCLQDIHWSMASMGYFPTYTLGNLYSAQFFEQAREDLGDLDAAFEKGDFSPLLTWLREKIHGHGRRYLPEELCRRVTGKPLSAEPLLRHLEGKLLPLYGL
jgi:carboxypeptidase Taq